jgi:hypothetical protein
MGNKYTITAIQHAKAKEIGVVIRSSTRKHKKLDVFDEKTGEYIASIGDDRYDDYHTYLKKEDKEIADARRKLYKLRHEKDIAVQKKDGKYTPGYLAWKLLW